MSTITLNEKIQKRSLNLSEGFLQNKSPLWAKALELWAKSTLPSAKDEFWKYIKSEQLWPENRFQTTKQSYLINKSIFPEVKGNVIFFVDGYFDAKQSIILDQGIVVQSIQEADVLHQIGALVAFDSVFSTSNYLFAQDGIYIHVPKNTTLEYPIYIQYLSTQNQSASYIRNVFTIESKAQIVQHFESATPEIQVFENVVNEVWVRENASLEWLTLQHQNLHTQHIQTTHVQLKANALIQSHYFSTGGGIIRNNIQLDLDGTGIDAHLYGVSKIKQQQVVDHHTYIAHNQPHCESTEMYKHMVSDKATSVFNGKIYVKKDAQKTNAFQSSQNILLSDTAKAYSKPELEIYADDVKCSHGSTTGQLNEEAKFYLKARGIGEEKATQLLLGAFVDEVLEKVHVLELKPYIQQIFSV